MRAQNPFLLAIALGTLQGCASGAFQQVNFAAEGAPDPKADPKSQTVYVVPNAQMKDTILDARIRAKLEAFLLTRGYVLSTPEKAELYVLATFGTGKRLVASEASVFRPAEVAVVRDRQGNPIRRAYTPERMQSLSSSSDSLRERLSRWMREKDIAWDDEP